jgi:hypothetical protein
MTRWSFASLCAVALATALPASAQQLAPAGDAGITTLDLRPADDETPGRPPLLAQSQAQATTVSVTRRRRGSMVGYIDDASVESNVRIRFDAAGGNSVPDRAEFFYAKCGCYRGLAGNPAFDPDAPGPGPGIVTDLQFQQLYLEGEAEVAPHFSVLGQVPLRWLQPQSFVPGSGSFPNHGGIGDIRAGVKLAFVDTATTIATVKAQVYFPTGDALNGLGTDHVSVEPAFLLWNALSPKVTLESQFGVWLPVGGAAPVPTSAEGHFAGRLFYYGIGPAFTVYDTGRTSLAPVVELVGWHVQDGFETAGTGDASGTDILNLKIGARFVVNGGSFYAGWGHALTDAAWYTDIVRFEYRYNF